MCYYYIYSSIIQIVKVSIKKCLVSNTTTSHKPSQKVYRFDKNVDITSILNLYNNNRFNSFMYKNININYLLSFKNRFNMNKNNIDYLLNLVKENKTIVCF